MNLTPEFCQSYENHSSYPLNLIDPSLYLPVLRDYKRRLDGADDGLFIKSDLNADLPIRDLTSSGDLLSKKNLFSSEKLRTQLGDNYSPTNGVGQYATKRDPCCRFIFLYADNGRAKLKLTKDMLARIMTFHQVMPRYLEFLFLFGEHSGPHELRYSGFREQTHLNHPTAGQQMLDLGRSGKTYQMCYNLKTVDCLSPPSTPIPEREWSIRQAAVCHQFDVICGTTLWIIAKGGLELQQRVKEATGKTGRKQDRYFDTPQDSFRSSLAIHMLVAYWAVENWRTYTQHLEQAIDKETEGAIHGTRVPNVARIEYTPLHLQRVQIWEEKCTETEVVIGGNVDVLTAIKDYYHALLKNNNFPLRTDNETDINVFVAQLEDVINDMRMQVSRAKLLTDITSQRKTLILQHMQSQAAEEMKSLSIMSQKEAVAMRIITVVTLLYLPATFVSTFFSTDVVKYQNDGLSNSGSGITSFSSLAMYRWLQVTLPLTLFTLIVAWLAYKRAKDIASKKWENKTLLPFAVSKP